MTNPPEKCPDATESKECPKETRLRNFWLSIGWLFAWRWCALGWLFLLGFPVLAWMAPSLLEAAFDVDWGGMFFVSLAVFFLC
ncbi:MAG TPA: hypothetical protein VG796_01885, partial [Verrucomicrobiales bacterium]|nr:hypothetical protein [Verrucomicrobiales bacterium]